MADEATVPCLPHHQAIRETDDLLGGQADADASPARHLRDFLAKR